MSHRIAQVACHVVRYPVQGHFRFFASTPARATTRDTAVIKLTDEDGNVGWGQSVPSPTWSYETLETVCSTIEHYLGPALIGADAFDDDEIWRRMNRQIAGSFSIGQPICKAGIELALFDLTGRVLGQSPAERWRRTAARDAVTLSWTIDPARIEDVESSIAAAFAAGFRHFNIKVGRDAAFDVAVCREVRRLAPAAFAWVDANGGYDLEQATEVAPRLADLGMAALEQPLPANRLSGYATLCRQRVIPILMDEGIVSLTDLAEFHQLGLLNGVALKVARCGGLAEARRIVEYLRQEELLFFASGLTDPDLALAASLHVLAAYDLELPAALNAPQFLTGTILREAIRIDADQAEVPRGPGLGVEVDESRLPM